MSLEAEKSVIGAVLLDNAAYYEAELTAADFANVAHQHIWTFIQQLSEADSPIDLVTLTIKAKERGGLELCGGSSYLAGLLDYVPTAANIAYYVKAVKSSSAKRTIRKLGQKLQECAGEEDAMEMVEATLFRFASDSKAVSLGDMARSSMKTYEERYRRGRGLAGISYGYDWLDYKTGGICKEQLIVLAGRPSMGKELTLDSNVLLSDGTFKKNGDIMIGDKVASIDGKKSKVTGVFPQGKKDIYRVTFSDGRCVDAGLEHQWEVMYRDWSCPRILTTAQIIEKLETSRYKKRLSIPNHSADFGKDNDLLLHPYLIGVLLGDGGFSGGSVKITTSHEHILEKIKPLLRGCTLSLDQKITYRIRTDKGKPNSVLDAIQRFGLFGKRSHEKFIPAQYLSASKESRLELMRGMIDTDGTVEKHGSMTYSTSSEQMAIDFQTLARSLGAYASMTSRIPTYKYKGKKEKGKRSYCIYISFKGYADFVTIPHKKKRVQSDKKQRLLNIESIEPCGNEECQCISVSHDRSLYLTNDYISTHNTAFALNIAQRSKARVYFASLETSKQSITDRFFSQQTRIDLNKFKNGKFESKDFYEITDTAAKMQESGIFIDDTPAISVAKLKQRCRRHKIKYGLDFIVIDYLQLMTAKAESRFQEVSLISRQLKSLAKEVAPVIALAQLSRQGAGDRAQVEHLRESGQIEQDADLILFPYRAAANCEKCKATNKDCGESHFNMADLTIAKQKDGPLGRMDMYWTGRYQSFEQAHKEA